MLLATITVDADGRLTDDSTLIIDGTTHPIPARTGHAGTLAPARICQAIADAGYRPATTYYDDLAQHVGHVTVDVVKA